MTQVFKRVYQKKVEAKLTWEELAHEAGIKLGSWMTGIPTSQPTDAELKAMAPVLHTTYKWLKYGRE